MVRILVVALFVFQTTLAFGQNEVPTTNGSVYTLAKSGNVLYVGGSFSRVGAASGSLVVLDTTTAAKVSGWPRANGEILTVISDGAGGYYVGGDFSRIGGFYRNNLAR